VQSEWFCQNVNNKIRHHWCTESYFVKMSVTRAETTSKVVRFQVYVSTRLDITTAPSIIFSFCLRHDSRPQVQSMWYCWSYLSYFAFLFMTYIQRQLHLVWFCRVSLMWNYVANKDKTVLPKRPKKWRACKLAREHTSGDPNCIWSKLQRFPTPK
jgi:hypothetical protein